MAITIGSENTTHHLLSEEELRRMNTARSVPSRATPTVSRIAPTEGCPLLEMHDAVVRREGKEILSVDDFSLAEGESIALLGPNGAGKSTFINIITRDAHPLHRDMAPVRFRGQERASLAEMKMSLGVVSSTMQDQITVSLSAMDVVAGGLFGSLGVPQCYTATPDQREAAMAVMGSLGIAHLAERNIRTMSTGQARRVLIARALVHDPDVIIFDEPCTGLDPQGMFYVRRTMREIARSGKPILLVTHYPEDIIPEIDRLLLIKDGHIYRDGAKKELMTSEVMSDLFEVPLTVVNTNGCYSLASEY